MMYRISPPETTPEYDEWLDAQDEKKALLKKASAALEPIPFADVTTYDELDAAITEMEKALVIMKASRDEYSRLDDMFPVSEEPE